MLNCFALRPLKDIIIIRQYPLNFIGLTFKGTNEQRLVAKIFTCF